MAFPEKSSLTKMSASYQSSHQNFADFSASNRTSVWRITLKLMEQAKEPTKHLNNTYVSSVAPNRTIGMHGSPLPNTPRTHGPLQLRRKHHSTYL